MKIVAVRATLGFDVGRWYGLVASGGTVATSVRSPALLPLLSVADLLTVT